MSDFHPAMPHHGLIPIFEDAWYLQGSVAFKPLVRLQRNMVILRDGDALTLISAIRLNPEGEAALEALGTVTHVVKIGFHGMDDAYYADKYGAKLWGLPNSGGGRSEELTADHLPHPALSLFLFEETVHPEAALLFDREGGLLITCDAVQHWVPSDLFSLPAKLVTRAMGFQHPCQIGPPWQKKMTPEGGSLRPDFERLVALPFTHLIGGHGGLCAGDAPAQLRGTITRVFDA